MKNEIKSVRVRVVNRCLGCSLMFSVDVNIDPRIIKNAQALIVLFDSAIENIEKATCPECNKLTPTMEILRSLDGSGREWNDA